MCVGHIRTHSPLLLSENYYSSLNGYENHTEILRSRFGEMTASTSLCGAEMCSGRGRERGSDKSSGVGSGCNSTSGSKKHDVSHYNSNSTYISTYNSTHSNTNSNTNSNASSTNSIVASQYFTSTITQSSSSKYRCSSSSTPDSPVPVPLLSDSCSSSRRRVMNFREYVAAAMVQRWNFLWLYIVQWSAILYSACRNVSFYVMSGDVTLYSVMSYQSSGFVTMYCDDVSAYPSGLILYYPHCYSFSYPRALFISCLLLP